MSYRDACKMFTDINYLQARGRDREEGKEYFQGFLRNAVIGIS